MKYYQIQTNHFDPITAALELGPCQEMIEKYGPGNFQLALFSSPYPDQRGFDVGAADFCQWLDPIADKLITALNPVSGVLVHNISFKRLENGGFDWRVFDVGRLYESKGLYPINVYVWDKINPAIGGDLSRFDHDGYEFLFVFGRSDRFTYRPEFAPYAHKTKLKAKGAAGMRKAAIDGTHGGNGASLSEAGARQPNIIRESPTGGEGRPRAYGGSWPLPLAARIIRQFSNEGDRVVDPFCGVGTSLIAAIRAGRHCVGIDTRETELRKAKRWIALEAMGLKWYDKLPVANSWG